MKKLLLIILLMCASVAHAAPNADHDMTDTDVIACSAIETAGVTYTEALAAGSWVWVDVLNECDCALQVRQDDETGAPASYVPAGTSEIIKAGENGAYISGAISIRKYTGETCTSGNAFTKAGYLGDGL
jgi:hypothetical protein